MNQKVNRHLVEAQLLKAEMRSLEDKVKGKDLSIILCLLSLLININLYSADRDNTFADIEKMLAQQMVELRQSDIAGLSSHLSSKLLILFFQF